MYLLLSLELTVSITSQNPQNVNSEYPVLKNLVFKSQNYLNLPPNFVMMIIFENPEFSLYEKIFNSFSNSNKMTHSYNSEVSMKTGLEKK